MSVNTPTCDLKDLAVAEATDGCHEDALTPETIDAIFDELFERIVVELSPGRAEPQAVPWCVSQEVQG